MEYRRTIRLTDGSSCLLRNGTEADARAVLDNYDLTHAQTDYLLSCPGEKGFSVDEEAQFLREKTDSARELQLLAELDGAVVGMAGIACVGEREKLRHRASLGISIDRAYWGLGIGRALMQVCIECAGRAGYAQLELDVVAENERAIALYESLGFTEFGRNPRGFRSRRGVWQELVLMRLELEGTQDARGI